MPIYFYHQNERPYGCFSNFSAHGFDLDGAWWPTSEHYFQAQKFAGTPHVETVRLAPTAMAAANVGRDRSLPLRADWDQVKDDVMRRAVLQKFTAHPELQGLRRWMLVTRDAHGLYQQQGFQPARRSENVMEITHPGIYKET